MAKGEAVGTTRARRKPEAAKSFWNSSWVRSRPPGASTSISRSRSLPNSGALPGPMTASTTKSLPWAGRARRQFERIVTQCASSQSWMMCFMRQALPRAGTLAKKSAGENGATGGDAGGVENRAGGGDNFFGVVEDAAQRRIRLEDGGEESGVAAAHVDQRLDAGEIGGGDDGVLRDGGETLHGEKEGFQGFGMARKKVEERHSEDAVEGRLAGLHAAIEIGPGACVPLLSNHQGGAVHGMGRGGAQRVGEWCEREAARRGFGVRRGVHLGEDAHAGKCAEKTIERRRVGAGCGGDFSDRARARGELVGDGELSGSGNGLRNPAGGDHLQQGNMGGHFAGRRRGCGFGHGLSFLLG